MTGAGAKQGTHFTLVRGSYPQATRQFARVKNHIPTREMRAGGINRWEDATGRGWQGDRVISLPFLQ
jgi:hypothetical protein